MLKIAAAILSIYMSLFALVGFVVYKAGVAIVDVTDRDDGRRIFIPVPVGLIAAGVNLIPDDNLLRFSSELEPHQKQIQAIANELENCPDGIFVEVESSDQRVIIEKRGGNFILDAESPNEDVYIRVPIKATGKLFSKLSVN